MTALLRHNRCACITIGELEVAAGIPRDHASRFAFWQPFGHLKERALAAAVEELHRRIDEGPRPFRLPSKPTVRRANG